MWSFRRKVNQPYAPKTHDYTKREWGHDYNVIAVRDGGIEIDATGWGHGVRAGDYCLFRNGKRTTRYRVVKIEYYFDPSDMWSGTFAFALRPSGVVGCASEAEPQNHTT